MVGSVPNLAFKDQLNGIAYSTTAVGTEIMYTTDGGLTWTMDPIVPNPATADTLQGKLYTSSITAIPNTGYVSYGTAQDRNPRLSNRGASFSHTGHGLTWTDIDKGRDLYTAASFIQCGAGGYQGYLGGFTSATGSGGLYQIANTCALLATKAKASRPALLTAAPNPSPDGQIQLHFAEAIQPGTSLAVFDALSRPVLARALAATTTGSDTAPLDLTHQPPGIYTLRLTTPAGAATHKLVIQ